MKRNLHKELLWVEYRLACRGTAMPIGVNLTFKPLPHVDLPHTPVACGGKPSCSAGSP